MLELQCIRSQNDKITAEAQRGGAVLSAHDSDGEQVTVYANKREVITFANGLLELVGEALPSAASESTSADRLAALAAAREHVDTLSTNKNGYHDGVGFAERESAVRHVAAFLLGEGA